MPILRMEIEFRKLEVKNLRLFHTYAYSTLWALSVCPALVWPVLCSEETLLKALLRVCQFWIGEYAILMDGPPRSVNGSMLESYKNLQRVMARKAQSTSQRQNTKMSGICLWPELNMKDKRYDLYWSRMDPFSSISIQAPGGRTFRRGTKFSQSHRRVRREGDRKQVSSILQSHTQVSSMSMDIFRNTAHTMQSGLPYRCQDLLLLHSGICTSSKQQWDCGQQDSLLVNLSQWLSQATIALGQLHKMSSIHSRIVWFIFK